MSQILAEKIRAILNENAAASKQEDLPEVAAAYHEALEAVVAKCEQIRAESPTLGWGIADTFLQTIASVLYVDASEVSGV